MNAAVYDFAAIAKLTKAFPEDRPQNVVEKPAEPESPAYSYSSDDLQSVDYGMFAGFVEPLKVLTTICGKTIVLSKEPRAVYVTDGNDTGA
jgi:hypothetical protein